MPPRRKILRLPASNVRSRHIERWELPPVRVQRGVFSWRRSRYRRQIRRRRGQHETAHEGGHWRQPTTNASGGITAPATMPAQATAGFCPHRGGRCARETIQQWLWT